MCNLQRRDICDEFTVWHFATKCASVQCAKPWMSSRFSESRDPSYVNSACIFRSFFGYRPKCFWNDWKKFSNFGQNVWKYRVMNIVEVSFNTTLRQMAEMFQRPKWLIKKTKRLSEKNSILLWSRMSQERLTRQVLPATSTEKRSGGRPRSRWSDCTSDLACSFLGVEPAELSEIAADHGIFRELQGCRPRDPPERKACIKMNEVCQFRKSKFSTSFASITNVDR